MTRTHRWAEFQRLLREAFHADPRYSQIPDYCQRAWMPPSECTPLPAIPLKVTCREMGLDPQTVCDGTIDQVARRLSACNERSRWMLGDAIRR